MEGLADDYDVHPALANFEMPKSPLDEEMLAEMLPIFAGDEDLRGVPLSVVGVVLLAREYASSLRERESVMSALFSRAEGMGADASPPALDGLVLAALPSPAEP